MWNRVAFGTLALIGLFALSAPAAHAGGAAGAATLETFFECQPIKAANLGEVVSTYDFADNLLTENLRLGNGVLVCRQVNIKRAGVYLNPPDLSADLKCYTATTAGSQEKVVDEVFTDALTQEGVRVSQATRLLCGPVQRTAP